MGRWEHRYLGWDRFPDPSTPIEIEQLFTLESDELACARARRTPLHRLAVALHIVFLKTTGRLLNSFEIVPVSVLEYLDRHWIARHRTLLRSGRFTGVGGPCSTISRSPSMSWASTRWASMPNAALSPISGVRLPRCSIPTSSWHAPGPGWPITTTSCLTNVGFGVW